MLVQWTSLFFVYFEIIIAVEVDKVDGF